MTDLYPNPGNHPRLVGQWHGRNFAKKAPPGLEGIYYRFANRLHERIQRNAQFVHGAQLEARGLITRQQRLKLQEKYSHA